MKIYLKGYYGYKNFGDELLLLGVINYLYNTYSFETLYIESQDTARVSKRLYENKKLLECTLDGILPVKKRSNIFTRRDLTVFGGGEVVTDARGIPYNGWTYLFWFFRTILTGKYILLGGIGTIKFKSTKLLYSIFLKKATMIRTRDSGSFTIAKKYNKNIIEAKDFAYDVLDKCTFKKEVTSRVVVNCNPYIRSPETKQKITEYIKKNNVNGDTVFYIPAEIGIDDSFFDDLAKENSDLKIYDRTKHSLNETITITGNAKCGIGARLHFLLLLDHYGVPYEPLIYQEKITKVLLNK